MSTNKSAQMKRDYMEAREYVAKVGKPEPHFRDGSVGRLHDLMVKTRVCHQAAPSATNYWDDTNFDAALAEVVRRRFGELSKEAIDLMESRYRESRIAEKDALLAQLAEIEALETAAP